MAVVVAPAVVLVVVGGGGGGGGGGGVEVVVGGGSCLVLARSCDHGLVFLNVLCSSCNFTSQPIQHEIPMLRPPKVHSPSKDPR